MLERNKEEEEERTWPDGGGVVRRRLTPGGERDALRAEGESDLAEAVVEVSAYDFTSCHFEGTV